MSDNKKTSRVSGEKMFDWIDEEMSRRGMNQTEVARFLGISRPYLYALKSGTRDSRNLDREVIQRVASFVRRTVISVYIAAGIIELSDFTLDQRSAMEDEYDRAIRFICSDPSWGAICPETDKLDSETKLFIVNAYERATGLSLIAANNTPPPAITVPMDARKASPDLQD